MNSVIQQAQIGAGANAVAFKQVGFQYNLAGQLTNINRFNHLVANPNDPATVVNATTGTLAQSIYGYDGAGRMNSLVNNQPGGVSNSQGWTYDAANRVHVYSNSVDGSTTYGYTNNNQLLSATGAVTNSYTYNATGNRLTTGNQATPNTISHNRLTHDGTYEYFYDAEGNMTVRRSLALGTDRIFSYDNRNRLIEVADYVMGGSGPSMDIHYSYDAFDRRVERQATTNHLNGIDGGEGNDTSSTTDENYIYDGDHVVLSFLSTDNSASTLKNRYLYGAAVDQILAQEDASGGAHPILWTLADNLGSIRDVVDNMGALVSHYQYDAFGQVLAGDTSLGKYFYTGLQFDTATGLIFALHRPYDPATGKWLTEDPIGRINRQNSTTLGSDGMNPMLVDTAFADGANPFIYVRNNPTNATDPKGLVSPGHDGSFPDDALPPPGPGNRNGFGPKENSQLGRGCIGLAVVRTGWQNSAGITTDPTRVPGSLPFPDPQAAISYMQNHPGYVLIAKQTGPTRPGMADFNYSTWWPDRPSGGCWEYMNGGRNRDPSQTIIVNQSLPQGYDTIEYFLVPVGPNRRFTPPM